MMRINLLTYCCFFVFTTLLSNAGQATSADENFCYNADLPDALDELSVMCLTAPTLFCPPTFLGCPADNTDPSITGYPTALAGDPSCPTPVVSYTDQIVTNTVCLKIIHRTWEATYPAGSASIKLHSTCQQTIYLEDNSVPTINNCPSDIVIDLSTDCDSTATWILPEAEDDCGVYYFLTTNYSGTTFPSGTTTVTYTAQDYCGNMSFCYFDVTIAGSCCAAPAITCPSNTTRCPVTGNTTPTSTVASDPSCGTPVVTYSDQTNSTGSCTGAQDIQRTWLATDASDNSLSNSCIQTISVVDDTSPTITSTPSDISVNGNGSNCQVAVTWSEPSVTDDCAIASWTSTHTSGTIFPEGIHTVIYSAVDNCGNAATTSFTVTVNCVCNTAPILTCPSDYNVCPTNPSTAPAVTGLASAVAADPTCGTPVVSYTDNILSVDLCSGATSIERTWTAAVASDSTLSSNCLQQIIIADNDLPLITNLPQNITVTGTGNGCTVPVTWNSPSSTDNCGIASFTANYSSGDNFPSGITTVTYTAVDNCGNATEESFTVTVNCNLCTTPPLMTCPADYLGCPDADSVDIWH